VLVHLDKTEIPRYNIKHRGTKEAGQSPGSSTSANGTMAMSETTDYMQKMLLLKRLVELANSQTTLGEGVFFETQKPWIEYAVIETQKTTATTTGKHLVT
jgi:hypothetical protein